MSGDFYFYCQDCFSQWFTDGDELMESQQCLHCGSQLMGLGDLGKEGDMAYLILDIIRDSEKVYYEGHIELYKFAQKVFRKYFEPDKVEDEFNDRMREEY